MDKRYLVGAAALVAVPALVYYLCREPSPEEIIEDGFNNGEAVLEVAREFHQKKLTLDEVVAQINEGAQELDELTQTWNAHSDSPTTAQAAEIIGGRFNELRLKRILAQAYELYSKLAPIYHGSEPFREACLRYRAALERFPGAKKAIFMK